MALARFTRPDDSPVLIDPGEVRSCAPVPPPGSPLAGPLSQGTRITFKDRTHQDVKELIDEVERRLADAGG